MNTTDSPLGDNLSRDVPGSMSRQFWNFERNIITLVGSQFVAVFLLTQQTRGKPHNSRGDRNGATTDRRERPTWDAHAVEDLQFMIISMEQRITLPGTVMVSVVSSADRLRTFILSNTRPILDLLQK